MSLNQISVTSVVGWGVALLIFSFGAVLTANNHTDNRIEKLADQVQANTKNLVGLQAELPNIDRRLNSIERKIDIIIEDRGIRISKSNQ